MKRGEDILCQKWKYFKNIWDTRWDASCKEIKQQCHLNADNDSLQAWDAIRLVVWELGMQCLVEIQMLLQDKKDKKSSLKIYTEGVDMFRIWFLKCIMIAIKNCCEKNNNECV